MREELKGQNFEVVTVAADAKGPEAARAFIGAAEHPSLIDAEFRVAEMFDARNVPAAFWIDESGRIVRANDPVYAQRRNRETGEVSINSEYLDALRDWVANGAASVHVMDSERLGSRLPALEPDDVLAAVYFHLGTYLALQGHADDAIGHFKRAHTLRPENWTYKRQAWSLGDIERDYGTTFQEALKDSASGPFYPPLDIGGRA
jgi:tetratricopeptide (TPR) repeat protein